MVEAANNLLVISLFNSIHGTASGAASGTASGVASPDSDRSSKSDCL